MKRLPHYLGSAALCALALTALSGLALSLSYRAADPHGSLAETVATVPLGSLARGVHVYAGHLLIGALLAYLLAGILAGAHRPPRQRAWLGALALLALAFALAASGAVLPWSGDAQAHAQVASRLSEGVPLLGTAMRRFLLDGAEPSARTVERSFALHVAVLPWALGAALAGHVLFTVRAAPEERRLPPDFLAQQPVLWSGSSLAVLLAASLWPPPLAPLAATAEARPAWYFLPLHELSQLAPAELLGWPSWRLIALLALAAWTAAALLPFFDRRGSRWVRAGACVAAATLALLAGHAALR